MPSARISPSGSHDTIPLAGPAPMVRADAVIMGRRGGCSLGTGKAKAL